MAIDAQTVRQLFLTENATLKVTNNNLATDSVNPKRTHGGTIGNSIFGQQGLKAEYNLYDLILAVINDMGLTEETPIQFADETSVAPVTPGEPLISEIETWATSVSKANVQVFYTGTDTSTDPVKYAYFIDIDGNAILTTNTVPQGLSANLAIDNITGAFDIEISSGQVIKAVSGGGELNLRDGADGSVSLTNDNGDFLNAYVGLTTTNASMGLAGEGYYIVETDKLHYNLNVSSYAYMTSIEGGLSAIAGLATENYVLAIADNSTGSITYNSSALGAISLNSGSVLNPTVFNIGINKSPALGGVGMTIKTANTAYANQLGLNASGSAFETLIDTATLTADRTAEFPDASGIIEIIRYVAIATPTVHTATTGEMVDVTSGAGDLVLQLPSAVIANQVITVMKADAGAGKVKITPEGIETINGAPVLDLSLQYDGAKLMSTGTEWRVIGIA